MLGSLSGKIENDDVENMISNTARRGFPGTPFVTLFYRTTGIDVKAFTPFVRSRLGIRARSRISPSNRLSRDGFPRFACRADQALWV